MLTTVFQSSRRRLVSALMSARMSTSKVESQEKETEDVSFGFQRVDVNEKQGLVDEVFRNVAGRYDLMNDLMSCGMHRLWKDYFVGKVGIHPTLHHLDVAGGTGDIAFRIVDRCAAAKLTTPRVIVCDLNEEMIKVGQKRVQQSRKEIYAKQMEWCVGNAENLPFISSSFDSYTIAFGIRNCTHIDIVLKEAYRVLKNGGLFLCLEFSHVDHSLLRAFYDFYSFNMIPLIGQVVTGDKGSYQYLVESIRQFPSQSSLAEQIASVGFKDVQFENLMGGIVAIHSGIKLPS